MDDLSKDLRDAANQTPVHDKNRELMMKAADKIEELLDYTLDCNKMLVADLRKLVRYLVELCSECSIEECNFPGPVARLAELKEVARKLGALK